MNRFLLHFVCASFFIYYGLAVFSATNNASPTYRIKTQIADTQIYILMIELNKPIIKNAKSLMKISDKILFHSPSHGYFYIRISEKELRNTFGLEINTSVVKGAGNADKADAYFIAIKDKTKLKQSFKPLIKDLSINNDPKFSIIDDAMEFEPK
jgi:hypothetical protein